MIFNILIFGFLIAWLLLILFVLSLIGYGLFRIIAWLYTRNLMRYRAVKPKHPSLLYRFRVPLSWFVAACIITIAISYLEITAPNFPLLLGKPYTRLGFTDHVTDKRTYDSPHGENHVVIAFVSCPSGLWWESYQVGLYHHNYLCEHASLNIGQPFDVFWLSEQECVIYELTDPMDRFPYGMKEAMDKDNIFTSKKISCHHWECSIETLLAYFFNEATGSEVNPDRLIHIRHLDTSADEHLFRIEQTNDILKFKQFDDSTIEVMLNNQVLYTGGLTDTMRNIYGKMYPR